MSDETTPPTSGDNSVERLARLVETTLNGGGSFEDVARAILAALSPAVPSGVGERWQQEDDGNSPWAYGWLDQGGKKRVLPHLPTVLNLQDADGDAFPLFRRQATRKAPAPDSADGVAMVEALRAYVDFGAQVAGTCLGLAMSTDHPAPDEALMNLFERAQELAPKARAALSPAVPSGEGEVEEADLFQAIHDAMADERNGKPDGDIIMKGCEAAGYSDPESAADAFKADAVKRILAHLKAAPDSTDGGAMVEARPDDGELEPHLPEYIRGEKRCGIQRSAWMTEWYVPWSPRNENQNAEGPWSHWVALANRILEEDAKARAALSGAN